VPSNPEPAPAASPAFHARQLILLAGDLLLELIPPGLGEVSQVVEGLIGTRVLPGCYRECYDERFLRGFRRTIELTRNLLLSDTPFLPDTACELAAQAILGRAREVLGSGRQYRFRAAEIDPGLSDQLIEAPEEIGGMVELLADTVFEDADVQVLFEIEEPAGLERLGLREEERELLRFENWREPFAEVPRPQITDEGGSWPIAL
jgi:hypothetical protein